MSTWVMASIATNLLGIEGWSCGYDRFLFGGKLNAIHIGPLRDEASRTIPFVARSDDVWR